MYKLCDRARGYTYSLQGNSYVEPENCPDYIGSADTTVQIPTETGVVEKALRVHEYNLNIRGGPQRPVVGTEPNCS
ncbi:hypothetical protein AB205_0122120 [Aquarana catesbeiana]|uniref:Uncharacterized protein n=1 Tax=Aquarana catesbeiana TaxID=8400 RepID=A0A2G9R421_AQUCT|nr:hypothetical protein AB205_0122120 [Aquarana catesbeiana]